MSKHVVLGRALKLFGPGVNIELVQHYHAALCEERPEDVSLCVAVGDQEGELLVFESPDRCRFAATRIA